jgi:hypothetical protein
MHRFSGYLGISFVQTITVCSMIVITGKHVLLTTYEMCPIRASHPKIRSLKPFGGQMTREYLVYIYFFAESQKWEYTGIAPNPQPLECS